MEQRVLNAVRQGDAYNLRITVLDGNVEITDQNITGIRIGLGKYQAYWPDGTLAYNNGAWEFPMTQEMSYDLSGTVNVQTQVKMPNGDIYSSVPATITVEPSTLKGVW